MPSLNPCYKNVKQLIRKDKYPNTFGGVYGFSPYMACSHACKYCDGRYEKYNVEGDFEKDIIVRQNAVEILEKELPKLREFGPICLSSGISDVYQPIEAKENLTGRCVEVLAKHHFPVTIHSKSVLMRRDWENWKLVNQKGGLHVMASLTYAEDDLRKIIEPHASVVDQRIKLFEECTADKISSGVLAMPFIPYLTDEEQNLRNLFHKVKDAGVSYIMPGLLTLKAGRQKDLFLEIIKHHFPDKFDKIVALYKDDHLYGNPDQSYCNQKYPLITNLIKDVELPEMMPHKVYHGRFQKYQEVIILLSDMRKLYKRKGIDTRRLKAAQENFFEWLKPEKQYIARRRNLLYNEIDEKLMEAMNNGTFEDIIGNIKLADFFRRIFWEGQVFDYMKLKLVDGE